MFKLKGKKAQNFQAVIFAVVGAVIGLVVLGIVLGLGSDIITQIQNGQTSNTFAFNASEDALTGIDKVSGFQPTIGIVVAAVAVISIVIAGFIFTRR